MNINGVEKNFFRINPKNPGISGMVACYMQVHGECQTNS
jgi:hypothetical protein